MNSLINSGGHSNHESLRSGANRITVASHAAVGPRLASGQAGRLRQYIDANLSQRLDLETLARTVHLSKSHFARAFKQTFGITVHDCIVRARLERARQLMLNSSEKLSDIAASCGLSDQSHLTRLFRRRLGATPAAWRRSHFKPAAIQRTSASA